MTTQELVAGCSTISIVGNYTIGELDGCTYLMENIGQFEGTTGTIGYWLETPHASIYNNAWSVRGNLRCVYDTCSLTSSTTIGVRPVVEVLKSSISSEAITPPTP